MVATTSNLLSLADVRRGEFPVFLGVLQALEEAPLLFLLGGIQENLRMAMPLRVRYFSRAVMSS